MKTGLLKRVKNNLIKAALKYEREHDRLLKEYPNDEVWREMLESMAYAIAFRSAVHEIIKQEKKELQS